MDSIGNMFTAIRNALSLKKAEVSIPHSKNKEEIVAFLKNKKMIDNYDVKEIKNNKKLLIIKLKYFNYGSSKISAISGINRISKPGLRITSSYKDIKKVVGFLILSTNKGIISSDEAKKQKVGGEIVGHIW